MLNVDYKKYEIGFQEYQSNSLYKTYNLFRLKKLQGFYWNLRI